nr:MAG TPA: hypothetical protein [Bacteriophage sp.]
MVQPIRLPKSPQDISSTVTVRYSPFSRATRMPPDG